MYWVMFFQANVFMLTYGQCCQCCQLQILKDAVDGQDRDENVDISRQDLIFRLSAFTSHAILKCVSRE